MTASALGDSVRSLHLPSLTQNSPYIVTSSATVLLSTLLSLLGASRQPLPLTGCSGVAGPRLFTKESTSRQPGRPCGPAPGTGGLTNVTVGALAETVDRQLLEKLHGLAHSKTALWKKPCRHTWTMYLPTIKAKPKLLATRPLAQKPQRSAAKASPSVKPRCPSSLSAGNRVSARHCTPLLHSAAGLQSWHSASAAEAGRAAPGVAPRRCAAS